MEFLNGIEQSALAAWVRESPSLWAYPMILFLHTVGLGFLVGTSVIVDLRVLGVAPQLELPPMEKLYPFTWGGFWISAFSGVLLWTADASTMTTSKLFLAKLAFIALGTVVVRMLRIRIFRRANADTGGSQVRLLAWISLILWVGAITAGRMTAYLK